MTGESMRIAVVMEYPPSLMAGGSMVQAMETFKGLQNIGANVQLFDWSAEKPADIYHFVGFPPYMRRIAELISSQQKPFVINLMMGCDRTIAAVLNSRIRREARLLLGGFDAERKAARLIANTSSDACLIRDIYGVKPEVIKTIPNGVGERYFAASPDAWHREHGDAPFILCVGAIQPRKNQLLLAKACNHLQLPLVLLGDTLRDGLDRRYINEVAAAMETNTRYGGMWLRELTYEDKLLASAYAACRCFVLLSERETHPLSVSQAMAVRKPILLRRAAYTKDESFAALECIEDMDIEAVCNAINACWSSDTASYPTRPLSWNQVARMFLSVYGELLGKETTDRTMRSTEAYGYAWK